MSTQIITKHHYCGPKLVGEAKHSDRKPKKYIDTISASCEKGKCFNCYKLDCPHDCHKEERQ